MSCVGQGIPTLRNNPSRASLVHSRALAWTPRTAWAACRSSLPQLRGDSETAGGKGSPYLCMSRLTTESWLRLGTFESVGGRCLYYTHTPSPLGPNFTSLLLKHSSSLSLPLTLLWLHSATQSDTFRDTNHELMADDVFKTPGC